MPGPPKHHYIPCFYTKRWAVADGRLIEYRRGFQDRVFQRRTHPDGTGYMRGLNTIEGLPQNIANYIEDRFLQRADDLACRALDSFLAGNVDVDNNLRSGWTRFLISLLHRNPERMRYLKTAVNEQYRQIRTEFKERYLRERQPTDPETFEEYENARNPLGRAYASFFTEIVDSRNVGGHIMRLKWAFITFNPGRFHLLTSDRPMVMTNGIDKPDAHIVMPISPHKVFIAGRGQRIIDHLLAIAESGELLRTMNDRIVRQARKYVYANEPVQLRYLEKRLGQKIQWSPLQEAAD